jgi:hypothetical protein
MSTTGRVGQSAFCAWAGKIIAIQMHQAGFALAKPGHAAVGVLYIGVEIIRVHVRPRDRNDELGLSRNVTLFFCLGIHRQQRDDETKNKGNENIE